MRHRRHSPYSRIEELRHSRQELLGLALLTVVLGVALGLLADLLGADLDAWLPRPEARYLLVGLSTLGLVTLVVALFYSRSESRRLRIEVQVPYHLPGQGQPRIATHRAYGLTTYARRAFMRRYRRNSQAVRRWRANWQQAEADGIPFQEFIAPDNAALVQCLLLYVLHRYGQDSLGQEAAYGWWKVHLPARRLTMDDLPPGLGDNPFLRADQRAGQWRLWWPAEVRIELAPDRAGADPFPRWRLRHRRYGCVEIGSYPHLTLAGRGSQVWQVLTQRLKLAPRSRLFIVGTRLEARARFRWTFWPRGDAFHDWATGLLIYLEEALDWGYYLDTRTDRLVAFLDMRVGWVPKGSSLWDKLQEIEGRLEQIEVAWEEGADPGQVEGGRRGERSLDAEGEALVV